MLESSSPDRVGGWGKDPPEKTSDKEPGQEAVRSTTSSDGQRKKEWAETEKEEMSKAKRGSQERRICRQRW